jgi:hypothetical protein
VLIHESLKAYGCLPSITRGEAYALSEIGLKTMADDEGKEKLSSVRRARKCVIFSLEQLSVRKH